MFHFWTDNLLFCSFFWIKKYEFISSEMQCNNVKFHMFSLIVTCLIILFGKNTFTAYKRKKERKRKFLRYKKVSYFGFLFFLFKPKLLLSSSSFPSAVRCTSIGKAREIPNSIHNLERLVVVISLGLG